MRVFTNKGFLVFLMLISSFILFSQGGPPFPKPAEDYEPYVAPIDTHLIFLFILALLYGLYKVYQHTTHKKTPN